MKEKGQLQLSFGMIFSIIIIIATLAVAFYVIRVFLTTSDCEQIQILYRDLDKEVDAVWRSPAAQTTFIHDVPSSIRSLCFGDPRLLSPKKYPRESAELARYAFPDRNVHATPENDCGKSATAHSLAHVSFTSPFCVSPIKGKISLKLSKSNPSQSQVTLSP